MADTEAVQSNGDLRFSQSRGAPWFPVRMIHPLVARYHNTLTPMRKLFPLK